MPTLVAARIVPIDPLLANVSAADARMLFYWPGEDVDLEQYWITL